jgi:hypothetical protein
LQFETEQRSLLNFWRDPILNPGLLNFPELAHSKTGTGTLCGGRRRAENRTRPPPWGDLAKCSPAACGPGATNFAAAGKAAIRDRLGGKEARAQPGETTKAARGERPLFSLSGRSCRRAGGDPHQV